MFIAIIMEIRKFGVSRAEKCNIENQDMRLKS